MLAFDTPCVTVMTVCSALIHELGHITAAIIEKIGTSSLPRAVLTGFKIHTGRLLSYKEELILASGGPLASLGAFVLLLPFSGVSDYLFSFSLINLLTALVNLIPLRASDGSRIVGAIVAHFAGPHAAEAVVGGLSVTFSALGVLLSLLFLAILGEGYWIFAIFFSVMLREIFKAGELTKNEN